MLRRRRRRSLRCMGFSALAAYFALLSRCGRLLRHNCGWTIRVSSVDRPRATSHASSQEATRWDTDRHPRHACCGRLCHSRRLRLRGIGRLGWLLGLLRDYFNDRRGRIGISLDIKRRECGISNTEKCRKRNQCQWSTRQTKRDKIPKDYASSFSCVSPLSYA
jgi:hypothetical protein